jgi:hypothetical protein
LPGLPAVGDVAVEICRLAFDRSRTEVLSEAESIALIEWLVAES